MPEYIEDYSDDDYRMHLITSRLKNWTNGKKSPPYQINLYFTKKCNLKCRFCYYSGLDRNIDYSNELTKEELVNLAEEGCNLGIDIWYVGGGEPFFYPDKLLPLMEIIKKHKKYGNVNTNGTLFNPEIINKLVSISWDEITFSVNSASCRIDDSIRGKKGSLRKAIKNIKLIQKIKKLNNKKKPYISIHSVITNKNYNKLRHIIKLGYSLGAYGINFTHIMEDTEYAKELKLTEKQKELFKKEVRQAVQYSEKLGIFTNLKSYIESEINDNIGQYYSVLKETSVKKDKNNLLSSICFEPWTQISVFADGTVGICGVWNPALNSENIRKKSISEIWYGDFFTKVRASLVNQKPLDECRDCASSRIFKNEQIKNHIKDNL